MKYYEAVTIFIFDFTDALNYIIKWIIFLKNLCKDFGDSYFICSV